MSINLEKLLKRTTLYSPNKIIKPKTVKISSSKKTTKKKAKKKTTPKVKNRYNQKMTAGSRSGVGRLQKIKGMA